MILAGVVIGEHGFNILARDSSFELFGKVGLYYIMFLAGLEMNMEDFKSIRVKATVLGLLAFIIPLGIGFWTNMNILGYSVVTSVLLASNLDCLSDCYPLWHQPPAGGQYCRRRDRGDRYPDLIGLGGYRRVV